MENPFRAVWSEQGHTVCLGHWEIFYRGRPLELPTERREEDMGTFGIFSFLFPDDPDFAEGLEEEEWLMENADWLAELFCANGIPAEEDYLRWFYRAVNTEDWRCGSCGGCI